MKRRQAGFTLLEVLVALAIIATVLLVMQGLVGDNIDRADRVKAKRTARLLARAKLEEVILGTEAAQSGSFEGYEGFRWSVEEGAAPITETQSVRRVTITVTYPAEGQDAAAAALPPPPTAGAGEGGASGDAPGSYAITTLLEPPER